MNALFRGISLVCISPLSQGHARLDAGIRIFWNLFSERRIKSTLGDENSDIFVLFTALASISFLGEYSLSQGNNPVLSIIQKLQLLLSLNLMSLV